MFAIKSPQTYHHQPGLHSRTGELLADHSSDIAIITSPKAWRAVNPQLEASLKAAGIRWQVNFLTTECSDAAIKTHLVSVREQNATLALPPLNGDRDMIIAAIAREVKFSTENAARLPFSMAAENIEKALRATEIHHYSQG